MRRGFLYDVWLTITLVTLAIQFVTHDVLIATFLGEPAIAAWSFFTGLSLFGVALSHVILRLIFPGLSLATVGREAMKDHAGLVFLGLSIILASFFMTMASGVKAGELPGEARAYLPILKQEQAQYWSTMPDIAILAGQVEQESGWKLKARLKTDREEGAGLGQITRTSRFDALTEMKAAHPEALKGWGWGATLYDAHYQLRSLVLKDQGNYRFFKDAGNPTEQLAMTVAAYNKGLGGVISDRRVCLATLGCNPALWFGNVEHTSLSKKGVVVKGYDKSFFAINRQYVVKVFSKADKYRSVI